MRKLLWPALLVLLTGCATAPTFKTSVSDARARVGSVYVYSFLDVREKALGARNLALSTTDNMNMWKADEYPEKRAFMLVDGLVKELQRVQVFK